eukprot:gene2124-4148_t
MGGAAVKKIPTPSSLHKEITRSFRKQLTLRHKSIVRREPLKKAEEIFKNEEAKAKITFAFEKLSPGESDRWKKLLDRANYNLEPTEEEPDPLRIDTDVVQLRLFYEILYNEISSTTSDSMAIVRSFIPEMYKKHNVERGMRISQYERDEKQIIDTKYAYSEISYEVFSLILEKIIKTYGTIPNKGLFYDLGSGVGQLVYTASILGHFKKCVGIEIFHGLIDRAEKRKNKFMGLLEQDFVTPKIKSVEISWVNGDFFEKREWTQATFIFLNWTALSSSDRKKLTSYLDKCAEGTFCVSLTYPIPHPKFEVLISDNCEVSWAKSSYELSLLTLSIAGGL